MSYISGKSDIDKVGGEDVPVAGTQPIVPTGIFDSSGNQINTFGGGTSTGGGSAGGGNNTYSTEQGDFTATVTDATNNIVLNKDSVGGAAIDENHFLNGILKVWDTSTEEAVTITLDDFNWTAGTKTLDTTNCTSAFTFATGDIVSLTLTGPDKSYDSNLDVNKTSPQAYATVQNTDSQSLVSASDIGVTDDTWIDQGSEIDVRASKSFCGFVVLTVNNSTGNQIQILTKTELGGSDEYVQSDSGSYQVTLGDANIKIQLEDFNTSGVSYLQVQTKATVVGATEGTVAIDYTLTPLT